MEIQVLERRDRGAATQQPVALSQFLRKHDVLDSTRLMDIGDGQTGVRVFAPTKDRYNTIKKALKDGFPQLETDHRHTDGLRVIVMKPNEEQRENGVKTIQELAEEIHIAIGDLQ